MNAMTWTLALIYVTAAVIIGVCVLKDMFRSIFRSAVSLFLLVIALPISVILTRLFLDVLLNRVMGALTIPFVDTLKEAFPSMEEGAIALAHMVAAPELWRIFFILVLALLALVGWIVCHFVEKSNPVLTKKHKGIGAAIGVVFGLILTVGILTPTAGYATEAPEALHTLEEVEQITHVDEETLTQTIEAEKNSAKVKDTPLLAAVRALGGEIIFDSLTTVSVDGQETNLHAELHALDTLGADVALLSAVPMEEYTDREYDALKHVGNVFESSALLRVLGAEGLSAMSNAWLKGETFLNIARPEMGEAMDFALDAVMVVMKNTTKDSVARDVRGLAPAISAALRAFNTIQSITTPPAVSNPDAEPGEVPAADPPSTEDQLTQIVDAIVETAQSSDSEETKEVLVRAGIGLVAKELEQFFVTGSAPAPTTPTEPTTPAEPSEPSQGTTGGESSEAPTQPTPPPASSIIPSFAPEALPEGTEITQETYEEFVSDLTDLAVSGGLAEEESVVVESVKDIRDKVGIEISDELCEQLVSGVLNSPYADLFDMFK